MTVAVAIRFELHRWAGGPWLNQWRETSSEGPDFLPNEAGETVANAY